MSWNKVWQYTKHYAKPFGILNPTSTTSVKGGRFAQWAYNHPKTFYGGLATATALTQTPRLYQPSYQTDPIPPFQKKDGGTPAKTDSTSPTDDFFGWVKGSPWVATGLGLGAVGLLALTIMALRPST